MSDIPRAGVNIFSRPPSQVSHVVHVVKRGHHCKWSRDQTFPCRIWMLQAIKHWGRQWSGNEANERLWHLCTWLVIL